MNRIWVLAGSIMVALSIPGGQASAHAGEEHADRTSGALHALNDVALVAGVVAVAGVIFWWTTRGRPLE